MFRYRRQTYLRLSRPGIFIRPTLLGAFPPPPPATIIAGIHADISSSLRPSPRSLFLFPSRPLFESKTPWNLALATVGGQLQYRLVFPTVISLPSSYIPRRVYRLPRYRANFRPRTYLCFSAIKASRREPCLPSTFLLISLVGRP